MTGRREGRGGEREGNGGEGGDLLQGLRGDRRPCRRLKTDLFIRESNTSA